MFVTCPDPACGVPAEITDRVELGSTSGPMEHVRTYCVRGHFYFLPRERVPGAEPGVVATYRQIRIKGRSAINP